MAIPHVHAGQVIDVAPLHAIEGTLRVTIDGTERELRAGYFQKM